MGDLTNPRIIYLKGALFVIGGLLASAGILLEHPTLKVALLLAVSAWCFARSYYFTFYVIEHYVDPGFQFAGLWSFVQYLASRKEIDRGNPYACRFLASQHSHADFISWLTVG